MTHTTAFALFVLVAASACEVSVREPRYVYAPPPPPPRRVVVAPVAPPPVVVTATVEAPPASAGQCPRYPSPPPGRRCGYACSVDVARGATNCGGDVRLSGFGPGRGLATIDMGRFHQLEATVTLSSAAGWSFDIGDSPSNDGFGGDAAQRSNDAELFALDGRLQLFGSDFTPPGAAKKAVDVPFGAGTHTILVEDQHVRDLADGVDMCAPYLLRLSPPVDREGPPDRIWYMSFDGVVSGRRDRTGRGLQRVDLCLR
jgi:hypothetical protein